MLGHFGFSYIGVIFLIMLMVPNIIWTKHQPKGYEPTGENKVLLMFERIGQVLVCTCAIIFSDFNIHDTWQGNIWLIIAFLCMLLYEGFWIQYFRSEQTLHDFYCDFIHIPLAGATLPVIAFFLLGIHGQVIWMMLSITILGIGHIGIHLQHASQLS